jgi:hypothetical protein
MRTDVATGGRHAKIATASVMVVVTTAETTLLLHRCRTEKGVDHNRRSDENDDKPRANGLVARYAQEGRPHITEQVLTDGGHNAIISRTPPLTSRCPAAVRSSTTCVSPPAISRIDSSNRGHRARPTYGYINSDFRRHRTEEDNARFVRWCCDPTDSRDHRRRRVAGARALRVFLDSSDGFDLVGEADNGIDAIALVRSTHPDVVLMDVQMPKMDGIEATQRLTREFPGSRSSR